MHKVTRLVILTLSIVSISLIYTAVASAGRGYYVTDQVIRTGMLVSLTQNMDVIEAANEERSTTLLGVAGPSSTDFDYQPGQVAVQTDGVVQALVSTLNGDIKIGDRIQPSFILGLGAKSIKNGWVVGVAQSSLDATTQGAKKTSFTDTSGQNHDVYVGTIPVIVQVTNYSGNLTNSNNDPTVIPHSVQKIADSIAGKRASTSAVILSFLLLLGGFSTAFYIIRVTVTNSIQGTARQPLARQAIGQTMQFSFLLAISLLVASIIGSLVIIKLL